MKTTLMVNYAKAYPDVPIVVIAPGVDLCTQLRDDFTGSRGVGNREVKLICSGSRNKEMSYDGITICSADSVDKLDPGVARLLLADEPHALVTDRRVSAINKAFPIARRIGFGATLKGRFDGADDLIEGLRKEVHWGVIPSKEESELLGSLNVYTMHGNQQPSPQTTPVSRCGKVQRLSLRGVGAKRSRSAPPRAIGVMI